MALARLFIPLDGAQSDVETLARLHARVWLLLSEFAARYRGSVEGTRLWSRYVDRVDRERGGASPKGLVYPLPDDEGSRRTDAHAVGHWLRLALGAQADELPAVVELYGAALGPRAVPSLGRELVRAAELPLVELRGELWEVEADRVVSNTIVLGLAELHPQERASLPSPQQRDGCRCDMCSMLTPSPQVEASMCHHLAHATSIEAGASASFYLGNMARPSPAACTALLAVPLALAPHAARAMHRLAPRCPDWQDGLRHVANDLSSTASARAVALSGLVALVLSEQLPADPVVDTLLGALQAISPASDEAALGIGRLAAHIDLPRACDGLLAFLGQRPGRDGRHHAGWSLLQLHRHPSQSPNVAVVEALRALAMDPDPVVRSVGHLALGQLFPAPVAGGPAVATSAPAGPAQAATPIHAAVSEESSAIARLAALDAIGSESVSLIAQARRWLEADGWPVTERDNSQLVSMASGHCGTLTVIVYAREKYHQVVVYVVMPERVEPSRRSEVAELLVRTNYGMVFGNFEMDLADGEVRYKTMIDAEGLDPVPAVCFKNLFMANVQTADRNIPWIRAVAAGTMSAADAAAAAARNEQPPPANSPLAPHSSGDAGVAALLRALTELLRLPRIEEGDVARLFGVELEDNAAVLFAPAGQRSWVARPADGLLEKVELTLNTTKPGTAWLNLTVRERSRFGREALDAHWLRPGQAPPVEQLVNAPPSPGSPPAAFEQWQREDNLEYDLAVATISVTRDSGRVARISIERRPLAG